MSGEAGAPGQPPPLAPGLRLGDFVLQVKLGEGGMGAVYRARQIGLDRDVAIKLLPQRLAADADFVKRFYREARLSARLTHPNIVQGIAAGEANGLHYFAMELIEGDSVDQLVRRSGPLEVPRSARIAAAVARALAYAHGKGLLHRDVKPANVIIAADGTPKLADLGLARIADDEVTLTRPKDMIGTPAYSAPEQMRGAAHASEASDVYALGATFYYMVTGRKPFDGTTVFELFEAKQGNRYPMPSSILSDLPSAVDVLIARLMASEPSQRYRTAMEAAEAFDALVDGRGSTATALPPRQRRRGGWHPRRWALVAAGVAVATAALLATQQSWRTRELVTPPAEEIRRLVDAGLFAAAGGDSQEAQSKLTAALARAPSDREAGQSLSALRNGVLLLLQYAPPDDPRSTLSPWSDRRVSLSPDDNYRIAILSAERCFVYLFQIDDRNRLELLFPNAVLSRAENPLSTGEVHWFPTPDSGGPLWLSLDGHPGVERVIAVATRQALPNLDSVRSAIAAAGPRAPAKQLRAGIASVAQAHSLSPCGGEFTRIIDFTQR